MGGGKGLVGVFLDLMVVDVYQWSFHLSFYSMSREAVLLVYSVYRKWLSGVSCLWSNYILVETG